MKMKFNQAMIPSVTSVTYELILLCKRLQTTGFIQVSS